MKVVKQVVTLALVLAALGCYIFGSFATMGFGEGWNGIIDSFESSLGNVRGAANILEDEASEEWEGAALDQAKDATYTLEDFAEKLREGKFSLWGMQSATRGLHNVMKLIEENTDVSNNSGFQSISLIVTIAMWVVIVLILAGVIEAIISIVRIFKNKEKAANNFRRHTIVVFVLTIILVLLPKLSANLRESPLSLRIGIPYIIMLVLSIAATIFWNNLTKKEQSAAWLAEKKAEEAAQTRVDAGEQSRT